MRAGQPKCQKLRQLAVKLLLRPSTPADGRRGREGDGAGGGGGGSVQRGSKGATASCRSFFVVDALTRDGSPRHQSHSTET
jgi:hypothetical protein